MPNSESSPSRCGWAGPLPGFKQTAMCQACDKGRSAGDVFRCQRNGGPRIEGLGDVIQAAAKVTGVSRVVKAVFGEDCGCEQRRAALNAAVPFTQERQDADQSLQMEAAHSVQEGTDTAPQDTPKPGQ